MYRLVRIMEIVDTDQVNTKTGYMLESYAQLNNVVTVGGKKFKVIRIFNLLENDIIEVDEDRKLQDPEPVQKKKRTKSE